MTVTESMLNGRNRTRHKNPLRLPKEGTKLRALYDNLSSGNWCEPPEGGSSNYYEQLRNFYNCEIETRRGSGAKVRMTGRWDEDYFVPVERLGELND